MKLIKDTIFEYIEEHSEDYPDGIITTELANKLNIQRSNLSSSLNQLVREGKLKKVNTKPVKFFLNKENASVSAFNYLIGDKDILSNSIKLAKAAMMYPDNGLATLITGELGTGKSYYAKLMYQFGVDEGILSSDAKLVEIDGKDYSEATPTDELSSFLRSIFEQSKKDFILIENFEFLSPSHRRMVLSYTEQKTHDFYLVCTMTGSVKQFSSDFKFPIVISLPTIEERSIRERLELITHFMKDEAVRLNMPIRINADILRSLMLYPCSGNIKQLKNDIRLACATAYLNVVDTESDTLTLYMRDFSPSVRKGFIHYPDYREEIEKEINTDFNYIISPKGIEREEVCLKHPKNHSIYQLINNRMTTLKEQKIEQSVIYDTISQELGEDFQEVLTEVGKNYIEKEAVIKVAGEKLTKYVETFLLDCSHKLGKIYSAEFLSALTLHLSAAINRPHAPTGINQITLEDIKEKYNKEYVLSSNFIAELNHHFSLHLEENEAIFVTMFLIQANHKPSEKSVQILVAMHGTTASSIKMVIDSLITSKNIHSFDLVLDKPLDLVYESLKSKILNIDQGKGIILIYDMGSIKSMAETISKETGVKIKNVVVPVTLVALEAARTIEEFDNIDEAFESTVSIVESSFQLNDRLYHRLSAQKAIVTLCMTGQGAAYTMKDYIEKNLDTEDIDIIALAIADRKKLTKELNQLRQNYQLICIVGTYNPKIIGTPFISASQLYQTRIEQLPQLLNSDENVDNVAMDYSEIYRYLKEQQPSINIPLLKRVLPKVLNKIKKLDPNFSQSQEVGLFLHLSSLISHLQQGEKYPKIPNVDKIITANKHLYYQLKDICLELEEEFEIVIPEAEYANMIRVIKEF